MVERYGAYIGGKWVDAESGEAMEVINPATGQVAALAARCGPADENKAVRAAVQAASGWAGKTVGERSKVLLKLSQIIMANQEHLARL